MRISRSMVVSGMALSLAVFMLIDWGGKAFAQAPAAQPAPAQAAPAPVPIGNLQLQNTSLVEVINQLARQLKINYILDPAVRGTVVLNTYGSTANLDARSLLDLILRINGAAMIQEGEIYRILPLKDAPKMPLRPQMNAQNIPEDDQIMLNLVFLKYVSDAFEERRAQIQAELEADGLNEEQIAQLLMHVYGYDLLRTLKTDSSPLLLKTRMEPAGHGGASGRYDRLKDQAFEYAWLLNQVGIKR